MGNQWGLGLHIIFVTIFLVATANSCLGVRNSNATVGCFEHERLALLKFKHSVGDASHMLSSWVGNNCCRWKGVMCDGATDNVESLDLRGGGLSSVAHSSFEYLVELRHLKYLDLSRNDFQGSRIPELIGSFKQLTYLNLSDAYFSGIIPHQIGNISKLLNLDLSHQQLVAHDMTWISGLSLLEHLDLSFSNLSGAKNLDMVLYMFPSLKELRLSRCGLSNVDLSPPLRNSSTSLSNVRHLDLSLNSFKGQLPHFFQNMTSLQFLDLSSFNFTTTWDFANFLSMIPSLLGLRLSSCNLKGKHLSHAFQNLTTLSNIKHLDLSVNKLTGPIPEFPQTLTKLDLCHNNLNGLIPESLGKLRLLQALDLAHNELTGTIPTLPGTLIELYLSFNYLNGSIPESFGRLASLTTLYLGYNQLSGTIPVSIGQLSKLRSLDISSNYLEGIVSESHFAKLLMLKDLNAAFNSKLTFNVSREWLPPFQLLSIDLSSCTIEKGFPQWLRNQRKLLSLELPNTTISGSLPPWLRKMPIIPYIDLSHNNLNGSLANLPNGRTSKYNEVHALFLQNNLFIESIPRSLCKRIDLVYLDLSRNRLSGKILKCFKNLQNLDFMKLNSNRLSGVIPSSIGRMSSLSLLNLNDNNFSGELPTDFWNLQELKFLDLGDNTLRGKIPKWIGERIKLLWVFRLHNNNFNGEIPRSLCTNTKLQILDVAHNNLTGTIPHCLGELQGMVSNMYASNFGSGSEQGLIQVLKGTSLEYTNTWYLVRNMDLSSNNLYGEIPTKVTALSALVGLNLSNNHLSGDIPENIGNMTALISLDLSGNDLGGLIPPSITNLTFLSHLNLSNNNLLGRIPTGNQLQTLTDPSIYEGNINLCGAPLRKNCSNHEDPIAEPKKTHEAANEPNKIWFYLNITCGFATGFWGVVVVLVLKKQWKDKLFMFVEKTMDKIHIAIMVKFNKMKRNREAI